MPLNFSRFNITNERGWDRIHTQQTQSNINWANVRPSHTSTSFIAVKNNRNIVLSNFAVSNTTNRTFILNYPLENNASSTVDSTSGQFRDSASPVTEEVVFGMIANIFSTSTTGGQVVHSYETTTTSQTVNYSVINTATSNSVPTTLQTSSTSDTLTLSHTTDVTLYPKTTLAFSPDSNRTTFKVFRAWKSGSAAINVRIVSMNSGSNARNNIISSTQLSSLGTITSGMADILTSAGFPTPNTTTYSYALGFRSNAFSYRVVAQVMNSTTRRQSTTIDMTNLPTGFNYATMVPNTPTNTTNSQSFTVSVSNTTHTRFNSFSINTAGYSVNPTISNRSDATTIEGFYKLAAQYYPDGDMTSTAIGTAAAFYLDGPGLWMRRLVDGLANNMSEPEYVGQVAIASVSNDFNVSYWRDADFEYINCQVISSLGNLTNFQFRKPL
jgi:hypothetical protein